MVQVIALLNLEEGLVAVNYYDIVVPSDQPVAAVLNSYAVTPEPIEDITTRATTVLRDNGWEVELGHWHSHQPGFLEAAVRKQPILLRWVKRNPDMPHRCPLCHHITHKAMYRAIGGQGYGLRTVMACPGRCGVKWRVGSRFPHMRMRDKYLRCRKP